LNERRAWESEGRAGQPVANHQTRRRWIGHVNMDAGKRAISLQLFLEDRAEKGLVGERVAQKVAPDLM
jgi:hypothetical protein